VDEAISKATEEVQRAAQDAGSPHKKEIAEIDSLISLNASNGAERAARAVAALRAEREPFQNALTALDDAVAAFHQTTTNLKLGLLGRLATDTATAKAKIASVKVVPAQVPQN
jgi:hypothetical protein